ncbi:hypothetical protein HPB47_024332, partial [Ixodes persulcatus]
LNKIQIPAFLLRPPLFELSGPSSFNYGGLGHVIAHEMMHAFNLTESQKDSSVNGRYWWTPLAGRNYTDKVRCFREEYDQLVQGRGGQTRELTDSEIMADFIGLWLAFQTFRDLGDKKRFADLPYNSRQLFFIASCVKLCAKRSASTSRKPPSDGDHPDFVPTVFAHKAPAKRSLVDRYARAIRRKKIGDRTAMRRDSEDEALTPQGWFTCCATTLVVTAVGAALFLFFFNGPYSTFVPVAPKGDMLNANRVKQKRKVMEVPVLAVYLYKAVPQASLKAAKDMVEDIRNYALRVVRDAKWLSEGSRFSAISKLRSMGVEVGYPCSLCSIETMDTRYKAYPYAECNFLSDWLNASHMTTKWLLGDHGCVNYPITAEVTYISSKNMIIIPASNLLPPIFSLDATNSTNFGGLGHLIATGDDAVRLTSMAV